MFDIGFWELALIGVVALLVVGPERLPKLARTTGLWVRKARRFVGSVRADIEQELRTEELKSLLDEGRQFKDVGQTLEQTRASLAEAHSKLSASATEVPPSAKPPPSDPSATTPPSESDLAIASAVESERAATGTSAEAPLDRESDQATTASVADTPTDPNRKHGG